jgi:hypothetical protein
LNQVDGLKEPQGVTCLGSLDQMVVVTNSGKGTVRFYAADGLRLVGEVQLAGDAFRLA